MIWSGWRRWLERRVGHDLLAAALGSSAADIGPGLRDAVSHNVLVAEDGGTYAFRHARASLRQSRLSSGTSAAGVVPAAVATSGALAGGTDLQRQPCPSLARSGLTARRGRSDVGTLPINSSGAQGSSR